MESSARHGAVERVPRDLFWSSAVTVTQVRRLTVMGSGRASLRQRGLLLSRPRPRLLAHP